MKALLAIEIPHKFANDLERGRFIDDLAAVYQKHGIEVEQGTFTTGTGKTPGLMIEFPYGIADFA